MRASIRGGYQARVALALAGWGVVAMTQVAWGQSDPDPDPDPEAEDEGEERGEAVEIDGEVVELEGAAPVVGEPTSYELDAKTLELMPGTAGDLLKAVQALPGAARIPFGLGGLVLRGTDPRDTNVYLDGVEVPILYHFGGLASFYPSSLVRELDVMPGGFGAAYGRGQGGLVTVRPRDARRDAWRVGGHVSLLDAAIHADGPAPGGGGVVAGLRRSYIDSILALVLPPEERILPRYLDGQVRWTQGTPSTGQWTASLFVSEDRVRASADGESEVSLTLGFARGVAEYRRRVGGGDTELRALAWVGADQLRFGDDSEIDDFEVGRVVLPAGARAEVVRDLEAGHLAAGLDAQGARYGVVVTEAQGMTREEGRTRWSGDMGLWTEARYRFDGGLLGVTPGLRLDRFGLIDEWQLAPRLTITHELGPRLTIRETVGLYHQPPNEIDVEDDEDQYLRSARSAHVAAGANAGLPASIDLDVTGFFILGDRQPVDSAPPSAWGEGAPSRSAGGLGPIFGLLLEDQLGGGQFRESRGRSRSYGLEIGASRRAGPWIAMLSYTLSRSERTDDPRRFAGWRPYELDQTHNLMAMASRRLGSWQLGSRLRYTTGNPYTPVTGLRADGGAIYGDPLSARMPPHIQLDVRVDYRWQPGWGRGTMKAFVDVQNVTNRRNAEGVDHDDLGEPVYTRGLPIVPIIGLEYTPRP